MALIGRRGAVLAGVSLLAGVGARKCAAQSATDFKPLSAIVKQAPAALPALSFTPLDGGAQVGLAAFLGKPVVLNFWATWCAPCVAELPELDQLAAGGAVTVVAVSADRGGAARVAPFLAKHPLKHVVVLLDPGSDAVHAVQVAGFPTTLILDAQGRLRGRLEGPAAWGSGAAAVRALVS
jgi:thiol-disulfide isomerase/thioredoxin